MNKQELRENVIKALKKKLGSKGKADFFTLDKKFDVVLEQLSQRMETQLLTRVEVTPNVVVDNLKEILREVMAETTKEQEKHAEEIIKSQPKEITAHLGKKPAWYKDAPEAVTIKNKEFIVSRNEKQRKEDTGILQSLLGTLFSSLVEFLSKLQKSTYKASLIPEHYVTPQSVVLLDPRTMKPLNPKDIGTSYPMQGGNAGPASVSIRGSNGIGDGKTVMTTAGVRQQLPNQACSRVRIQAYSENSGEIVVGGATVVALAGSSRRGLALYGSQWAEFSVDNLNRLYIDSTSDGDMLNYIYEYTI